MEQERPKTKEKKQSKNTEENQNLVGFFSLLLEIDKRENPELYKKSQESDD